MPADLPINPDSRIWAAGEYIRRELGMTEQETVNKSFDDRDEFAKALADENEGGPEAVVEEGDPLWSPPKDDEDDAEWAVMG